MAPTAKKPSAAFMIDVCSAVDLEMSPIRLGLLRVGDVMIGAIGLHPGRMC